MATITKSIGTTGRDYSTITLWEADLDDTGIYASGDDAVGECYADSDFSIASSIIIDGGGTVGLNSVRLTAASGERHDGTAGTGVKIIRSAATVGLLDLKPLAGTDKLIVEWLDIDGADYSGILVYVVGATFSRVPVCNNLLVHNLSTSAANIHGFSASARDVRITNCIVYNIVATGSNRTVIGLLLDSDRAEGGCLNNTVYRVVGHGTGAGLGIQVMTDDTDARIRNNIVVGCAGTSPLAFKWPATTDNITSSNNLSDDATADDGGGDDHVINATLADIFVSTTLGSEDLHLKSGSPAIDVGVDLGTTPTGVNIDINGRDRDAEDDIWCIGAHQYVALTAATLRQFGFQFYQDNAEHTPIGTENDANVSLAPGSKFRIRVGIVKE